MNRDQHTVMWMGLEAAFLPHLRLEAAIENANLNPAQFANGRADDAEPGDWLISKVGPIGLVNVSGSMTNRSSFFSKMFGFASYPEIKAALFKLADDRDVKRIVLNLNTPGGRAQGVAGVARAVKMIDQSVKPVYAHTSEQLCSAGYYIASQARAISTSEEAELGSIGAIAIHAEESKALENDGVKVTVLRTGKFKGIGNSVEPLTPEVTAELQSHLERTNDKFVSAVSDGRGVSSQVIRDMEGRTYSGDVAVTNGLADHLESLDSLVARLNAECNNPSNSQGGAHMKQVKMVSEAALAALASGAPIEELEAQASGEGEGADAGTAQGEGAGVETSAVAAGANSDTQVSHEPEIVKFLRDELRTAQASVVDLTAQVRQFERDAAAQVGTVEALAVVARTAIARLQVAVGDMSGPPDGLRPELLAEKFAALNAAFVRRFPVGQQTRDGAEASAGKPKSDVSAFNLAQVRSTSPNK